MGWGGVGGEVKQRCGIYVGGQTLGLLFRARGSYRGLVAYLQGCSMSADYSAFSQRQNSSLQLPSGPTRILTPSATSGSVFLIMFSFVAQAQIALCLAYLPQAD